GREIVRVNSEIDDEGGVRLRRVPTDELQRKGGEFYVRENTNLPPGAVYISPVTTNREHGNPQEGVQVVRCVVPIHDEERLFGFVVVNADATDMIASKLVRSALSAPFEAVVATDGGAGLRYASSTGWTSASRAGDEFTRGRMLERLGDSPDPHFFRTDDGRELMAERAAVTIGSHRGDRALLVAVMAPTTEILGPLRAIRQKSVLLILGLAVLVSLVSVLAASRLTAPLNRMTMELRRNVDGEALTLPTEREDEVGHLARAFDALTAQLRESHRVAESASVEARKSSEAKSAFLANMSHEIRTPLNAIIGLSELLLRSELTDSQRDYLKTVLDSGESLLALLNDILDLSKIEAGKLVFEECDVELRELVADVARSLAVRLRGKPVELLHRVGPDVPEVVVGDPVRLRQILVNLVGNAVKFTDRGSITVDVDVDRGEESSVAGDGTLRLEVRDTGIGISPESLEEIFDAFEQADSSSTRRHGGTGLGLAISRLLVRGLGGEITVDSVVGTGTRFAVTLPMTVGEAGKGSEWRRVVGRLRGKRLLVVDDNDANRVILAELLSRHGLEVVCHADARSALDDLERRTSLGVGRIDLVVTDANMPAMDGFEFGLRLRERFPAERLPIVLLTSMAEFVEVERFERVGFARRISKPVKESDLMRAITSVFEEGSDEPVASASEASARLAPAESLHILLAEDSAANRKLAAAVVDAEGHRLSVVCDGRAAVEAVTTAEPPFDVVLMDLQMPEMDGLEATARIRVAESQRGRRTPIVAMTAHAVRGIEEECRAAGMDGYVAKPFRAEQLWSTVYDVLGDRSGKGEDARAREEPTERTEALPSEIPWSKLMEVVGGNAEALVAVVAAYREEMTDLLDRMREPASDDDVARAAHQLKNTLRFFGQDRAADVAARFERGDAGRDREPRLESLEADVEQLAVRLGEVEESSEIPAGRI
ncbi:MAG: response regulator, partial [Planctomycetota bacterium JB042]